MVRARRSLRRWLAASPPMESVWPATSRRTSGVAPQHVAHGVYERAGAAEQPALAKLEVDADGPEQAALEQRALDLAHAAVRRRRQLRRRQQPAGHRDAGGPGQRGVGGRGRFGSRRPHDGAARQQIVPDDGLGRLPRRRRGASRDVRRGRVAWALGGRRRECLLLGRGRRRQHDHVRRRPAASEALPHAVHAGAHGTGRRCRLFCGDRFGCSRFRRGRFRRSRRLRVRAGGQHERQPSR